MSIRITNIALSANEVTVGQTITITVYAEETVWDNLKNDFVNWNEVRFSFTNWRKVLDYIYSKPDLVTDTYCIYDSDGKALFDVDFKQVSHLAGGESQYPASTIDWFIREVLNE